MKKYVLLFFFLLLFILGCTNENAGRVTIDRSTADPIQTFQETGDELCATEDGKPIIRMFSTSWCPHCKWIRETYTETLESYGGKIQGHLWELDTNDDLFTPKKESVPPSELELFNTYNPEGSIPTFVFGCQYVRVGNGYEVEGNLAAEINEFNAIIDALLEQ